MTRVFVDGAAGTTGLGILDRLATRPEFTLVTLPDDRRKDAAARCEAMAAADVAILCLPDDAARDAVAMAAGTGVRVIDASTAHRVAPGWTYGFPELVGRDAVAAARRVANPGCYPTGFLALVAPLVRAGLVAHDARLSVNAVSGYSGGGRAMIEDYEGDAAPSAWRAYALGLDHKHLPEMRVHAGLTHAPLFVPAVAPVRQGMVVAVPVPELDSARARDVLAQAYAGSAVVCVHPTPPPPALPIERAAGSDRLELWVAAGDDGRTLLLAALDNLGKGASGAAVQCLNLMAGLPETAGLVI